MENFRGKVAVVTGAASGIGHGMATVFANEGMKLVLADIERETLDQVSRSFEDHGIEVLAVKTDVSDRDSVLALADAARKRFGKVHVLCNNAGVGGATGGGPGIWNAPPESWGWMMGVNFMGVVHGLQAFVPGMLEHGEEGHIVNTSSVLGVWGGGGSIYSISKHAVTILTEGLFHDLRAREAKIGVSVLLPALTATRINTAARNRPAELKPRDQDFGLKVQKFLEDMEARYMRDGMDPRRVGETVLEAIRDARFYVFTHPGTEQYIEKRMRAMIDGLNPDPGPTGRRDNGMMSGE